MKGSGKTSSPTYQRLRSSNERGDGWLFSERQIPLLVGTDSEAMERLTVHLKLINHPSLAYLLDESANELGYNQQGLLRIWCDVGRFQEMLDRISTRL